MRVVKSSEEFAPVLDEPRSVVMLHGEWSSSSQWSFCHVHRWLSSHDNAVLNYWAPTFCVYLPPQTHDFVAKWIEQNPLAQVRDEQGNLTHLGNMGPLCWVTAGQVTAFSRMPGNLSFDELNQMTHEAFSRTNI